MAKYPRPRGLQKGRRDTGTGPTKRTAEGKEQEMLEWLKEILGDSYTEEIDKKVSAEIGKA